MKNRKKAYQITVYFFSEEEGEFKYIAPIFTSKHKAVRFYNEKSLDENTVSIEWEELN